MLFEVERPIVTTFCWQNSAAQRNGMPYAILVLYTGTRHHCSIPSL